MYEGSQSIKDFQQSVLLQRSVYECLKKIQNGRTNVTHDKGAGQSSSAIIEDNIEREHDMVLLDEWLTIDEVSHVLQISHDSA